tara:strand:- start:1476 stop:1637 length:162 start_codon:yes stop_codon:yes gene_type:complete
MATFKYCFGIFLEVIFDPGIGLTLLILIALILFDMYFSYIIKKHETIPSELKQ